VSGCPSGLLKNLGLVVGRAKFNIFKEFKRLIDGQLPSQTTIKPTIAAKISDL